MSDRRPNIKPCPGCGQSDWESFQKDEPIDPTGIRTFDKKKVWWRRCRRCRYEERIEA